MSGVILRMGWWGLLMRTVCDVSVKQNENRKLLSLISLYIFITCLEQSKVTIWPHGICKMIEVLRHSVCTTEMSTSKIWQEWAETLGLVTNKRSKGVSNSRKGNIHVVLIENQKAKICIACAGYCSIKQSDTEVEGYLTECLSAANHTACYIYINSCLVAIFKEEVLMHLKETYKILA